MDKLILIHNPVRGCYRLLGSDRKRAIATFPKSCYALACHYAISVYVNDPRYSHLVIFDRSGNVVESYGGEPLKGKLYV